MNEINNFYIKRRFSYIPEPYPPKDIEYFKDYYSARRYEITINENEMLYIPAGWFHFVISEKVDNKDNINVAVSFFTKYQGCCDCDIINDNNYIDSVKILKERDIKFSEIKKKEQPIKILADFQYNRRVNKTTIKNMFNNDKVLVNKSNNRLFISNFIKDVYPESCQEKEEYIEKILETGKANNYYLLQSECDFSKIGIIPPEFLKSEEKMNFSFWLNFGNIYSGLHYDIHNNVLLQLKGSKKILLFPPYERHKLHLVNKIHPRILCTKKKQLL